MNTASRSAARLEALGLSRPVLSGSDDRRLTLGDEATDARLGGLPLAACHEVDAASPGDATAAAGFALLLLARGAGDTGIRPLFWVRTARSAVEHGGPYGPGLAGLGIDPARLFLVETDDLAAALRAVRDIAIEGAAGGVLLDLMEARRLPDLTNSRRLAFAAGRPGTLIVLLRPPSSIAPSAAYSRWRVAAAPSSALEAGAPGLPAFDLTLTKHRGGVGEFPARLEWDHDTRSFRPLSGDLAAVAAGRKAVTQPSLAA